MANEDETLKAIDTKLELLIAEFRSHKELMEAGFTRDDLGRVDVAGHRAYHLAAIQRAARFESRRSNILDRALSGGMMSAVVFTAYSVWDRLLDIIRGISK